MPEYNIDEVFRKLEAQERQEKKVVRVDDILSLDTLREIWIEGLGFIRYGRLTVEDMIAISRIEDDFEKSLETVTRMLRKADPEVTVEKVKKLPIDVFNKLVEAITRDPSFFGRQTSQES